MKLLDRWKFLLEVKEILEKHNVEFWIDFGTLLGFYRQGDFLETDPDIDIGIKREEQEKVLRVMQELEEKNYRIITRVEGINHYLAGFKIIKGDTWIDIAFYFKYEDKRIWTISQWDKVMIFDEKYFNDLQYLEVKGTIFKIPNHIEELMILKYGEDWRRPFKVGEEYDLHKCINVESNEKYKKYLT
jgi:phosphorylcholine metabolism protein LicD